MYFIYDCNGKVIGNTKGYKTFKGALRQQDYNLGIQVAIRMAFDRRIDKTDNLLCSIKCAESNSLFLIKKPLVGVSASGLWYSAY